MKQQVNLYTPELRPQRTWWTLNQLAGTAALSILIIAVVASGVRWTLSGSEAELASLKEEVAALSLVVDELNVALSERREDEGLQERVEGLQRQVRMRRDLLTRADELAQASREGFSPYLISLARQSDNQLWLTRIYVDLMRGEVELQGKTHSGDQVPRYLHRLKQEAPFDGRRFAHFELDRERNGETLTFRLASQKPANEGGR